MTRQLEKSLERIKKLTEKQQYEKALLLVDEALSQAPNDLNLMREEMALSLKARDWNDVLRRLKKNMARNRLNELIPDHARGLFLNLVRDTALFRGALVDHLLNAQAFENISDLLMMAQEGDRRWLLNNWAQVASEIQDPRLSAVWCVAAGVGHLVLEEWDAALDFFSRALEADARFLKKIMTLCQRAPDMDMRQLQHRLRLIRLVIAAGKKEDSLSLLQALGMENRENALQVLIEIPNLLGEEFHTKEVCQLRFNLATYLQDPEILGGVLDELSQFGQEELFNFQKHAMVAMDDPNLRRTVLLRIAEIYIQKGAWEEAALILETQFQEDPHPEIIALMELVLENYPILTKLHLLVASYQLQNNLTASALRHLNLIKEIAEFLEPIQMLLEDHLETKFEVQTARFLFDILPQESDRAALIALNLIIDQVGLDADFFEHLSLKAPTVNWTPLWLLALLHAKYLEKKFNSSLELIQTVFEQFPDCAHEFLSICEALAKESDFVEERLAQLVEQYLDQIQPRDLWFLVAKGVKTRPMEGAAPTQEVPLETVPIQNADLESEIGGSTETLISAAIDDVQIRMESTDPQLVLGPELEEVKALVIQGELTAASQAAEKLAEKYPQHVRIVLSCLEQMGQDNPVPILWDKTRLNILIRMERFEEAAELGKRLLAGEVPESELPGIQQLMGFAFEGLGKIDKAVALFCKASRNARYYQKNKTQLVNHLFPNRQDYLEQVLELVLQHRDQATWKRLISLWERHSEGQLENIIEWQKRFADALNEPATYIDLAYWLTEAGKVDEAISILRGIRLNDAKIRTSLIQVTDLIKMKMPQDIHAGFLMGRFHLIQGEIPKAVDTFRNLLRENPKAGEKIFQYLRKYLVKHPEKSKNITLYGLMIRIALEMKALSEAVHLLREFAEIDLMGAQSLSAGVYRVTKSQENNREALLAYIQLMADWQNWQVIIQVHEENDLGSEMAQARLEMLNQAGSQRDLRDRAALAKAKILWETQQFEPCFDALTQIENPEGRAQSLNLFIRLAGRFPERVDIQRECAWLSWHFGKMEDSIQVYQRILASDSASYALEAFAVLREAGLQLDLRSLAARCGISFAEALREVRGYYGKLRMWALARWEDQGGPVPVDALIWLIDQGKTEFHQWFSKMKNFMDKPDRALLEAYALRAMGQSYYAAMRIANEDGDIAVQRSLCLEAGLFEQALRIRTNGHALPALMSQQYITEFGRPKRLFSRANAAQKKNTVRSMDMEEILELRSQDGNPA